MGCPRLYGEIYVEIYFPDVPPRNVGFGDFLGKVRVWQKGAHGYDPFLSTKCVFSCLKIFARLRAKILQIRAKTGHFGVKNGHNYFIILGYMGVWVIWPGVFGLYGRLGYMGVWPN